MRALMVYLLRSYTISQRYFGPVAGTIIAVLILYSYTPNPVMNSYAATAIILFAGSAWLGLSFLNHEHPVQRQVSIVQARSKMRYNLGTLLTLGLFILLLALLIVIFPVVTGKFDEPAGLYRMTLAFAGHFLLGLLGTAVSLYLQASWVPKTSYAAGLLLTVLIISIGANKMSAIIPGPYVHLLLPPAAPVMDVLMNADNLSLMRVTGAFVHALVYIVLLIGFYLYRSSRMDDRKSL
ncbi:hypothetical protein [Paenibacillus riograndensis]|uniref:Putative membrane protein n=1 Tax=Paenibacillus riograndensis SBR5 TaxID=1073571 RepID=A0A0E4CXF1_9BACL|nr:hypothetical protein [Paenibacillus riograndensis]CQR56295.1 putative membrane protein [Paenibacillus riograndensis SBR5]